MELAIPLLALGGLYISSSNSQGFVNKHGIMKKELLQKNTSNNNNSVSGSGSGSGNREGFATSGKPVNYLPNLNITPQNFPILNDREVRENSLYEYPEINAATDRYFNQSVYQNSQNTGMNVGNNIQDIYSLSGDFLKKDEFTHNNMVPFMGGKIAGSLYDSKFAENILDNMSGQGSQMIRKVEQPPLFNPQDNVQYTNGTPINTDFYQSRVNPGMNINNVKTFESQRVGPGLGLGFTTDGSGGFNSGMEDRQAWLPKTVDDLRVATNPKLEFTLNNHEGPAQSQVKNVGLLGQVEKNRPDAFFINTQDRWLTTTGSEKGETLRPEQEMGILRRNNCASDYMGPASNVEGGNVYIAPGYEVSKRNETFEMPVLGGSQAKCGNSETYEKKMNNYIVQKNNRASSNQPDTFRSGFSSAIGSVVAPLMDILRPSRKQELTNNVRIYGNHSNSTPAGYVYDSNSGTKTTMKETTLHAPRTYINNQKDGGIYVNNYTAPHLTQRNTTDCSTIGFVGGASTGYGDVVYDTAYTQTTNGLKSQTIGNRTNTGNMSLFNNQMNVCIARSDCSSQDYRVNGADSLIKHAPSTENYGRMNLPNKTESVENSLCYNQSYMDPNLLNAFRQNPYTQSLSSF